MLCLFYVTDMRRGKDLSTGNPHPIPVAFSCIGTEALPVILFPELGWRDGLWGPMSPGLWTLMQMYGVWGFQAGGVGNKNVIMGQYSGTYL